MECIHCQTKVGEKSFNKGFMILYPEGRKDFFCSYGCFTKYIEAVEGYLNMR